jgi:hypothetical protein
MFGSRVKGYRLLLSKASHVGFVTQTLQTLRHMSHGWKTPTAVDESNRLYNGVLSTEYSHCLTGSFKTEGSLGNFVVFQQMGEDGNLHPGVDLPFSVTGIFIRVRSCVAKLSFLLATVGHCSFHV